MTLAVGWEAEAFQSLKLTRWETSFQFGELFLRKWELRGAANVVIFPNNAANMLGKRRVPFHVVLLWHHGQSILRSEIIQRHARHFHVSAVTIMDRKRRRISWSIKRKIFTRQERTIGHLLLVSERI